MATSHKVGCSEDWASSPLLTQLVGRLVPQKHVFRKLKWVQNIIRKQDKKAFQLTFLSLPSALAGGTKIFKCLIFGFYIIQNWGKSIIAF